MSTASTVNASGGSGGTPPTVPNLVTPATTGTAARSVVPTAISVGLSPNKKCTTVASISKVISTMISERFAFEPATATVLDSDLENFFTIAGVTNDETFSFMPDSSLWPAVSKKGNGGYTHKSISVPVILLLSKLAGEVQKMLDMGNYLDVGVTYEPFHRWILSIPSKKPSAAKTSVSNDDHKIPNFKVAFFRGDILAGDKYMDDVVFEFTNHALEKYLTDMDYCKKNIEWSSAFASRIRESIKGNDILGFIATEEASERDCASLWTTVETHLTSSDLTMTRAMDLWNTLFGLKCEEKDSFLHFYQS